MSAQQLKTFADIYTAVIEACKIQSTDTTAISRIKRAINRAYQNEVVSYSAWPWLRESTDLSFEPKYTTGTAAVTQNSTTVTLSATRTPSLKGSLFTTSGFTEVYRVEEHTAGTATVKLTVPYNGNTDAAATFTLWNPTVTLPADCQAVTALRHDFSDRPLDQIGYSRYLEYVSFDPKRAGYPFAYATYDHVDTAPYATIASLPALSTRASAGKVKTLVFASDVSAYLAVGDRINISAAGHYAYNCNSVVSGVSTTTVTYTGTVDYVESAAADLTLVVKKLSQETSTERVREIFLFPGIIDTRLTLHADYSKIVPPLENDTDEPWLPMEDRSVLFLSGEEHAWRYIVRNSQEADRALGLRNKKLDEMKSKWKDTTDFPALAVSAAYLQSKRRRRRPRLWGDAWKRYD